MAEGVEEGDGEGDGEAVEPLDPDDDEPLGAFELRSRSTARGFFAGLAVGRALAVAFGREVVAEALAFFFGAAETRGRSARGRVGVRSAFAGRFFAGRSAFSTGGGGGDGMTKTPVR